MEQLLAVSGLIKNKYKMIKDNKEKKLKDLEEAIKNSTNRETWFYPEYKDVKGWLGTENIFFVGSNPSCNTFPTRHTELLYGELRENGFEDAHLTDLVKIRARNIEVDEVIEKYFKKHIKFFEKEIDILRPKRIIIMGGRAKDILEKFGYRDSRFCFIYHYSCRFPENRAKFVQQIKQLKI